MFIEISPQSAPVLQDAANFKAFKVVSTASLEDSASALRGAGEIEGGHAWISQSWVKQNGPNNAAWHEGFTKMLDYATKSGWVNEAGAIRAHIEWT